MNLLAAIALLPSLGTVQTGRLLPALETLVAMADRTFTGHLVKVDRTEFRTSAEGPDHREFLPANWRLFRYALTVRVEQNIRGKGENTITLLTEAQNERSEYHEWLGNKKSLLWTVGPAERDLWNSLDQYTQSAPNAGARRWLVTDLDQVSNRDDMSLGLFHLPLFTQNLDVVRTRKDALTRLQSYASSHPKREALFSAALPNEFVDGKGIPRNAYLYVVFPDDPVSRTAVQRAKATP
ncbi:hypothetical protein EON82_06535 [bacterium]|nr:MAG: hypothetical protein EON82_06535 [bacterium]